MYNINNPLHYITANKPVETITLIQKYGFDYPQTEGELYESVDRAAKHHGESFIADMTKIHPDKHAVMLYSNMVNSEYANPFITQLAKGNISVLETEIASLTAHYKQGGSAEEDADFKEKIDFLQNLIASAKQQNGGTLPTDQPNIHKTNQYILIAIVALALMFLGSKIFKQ